MRHQQGRLVNRPVRSFILHEKKNKEEEEVKKTSPKIPAKLDNKSSQIKHNQWLVIDHK